MAEIATAGTSTVAAIRGEAGTAAPGRANATSRASPGSSAARCQALSSCGGIGPQQQGERGVRLAGPQLLEGIHRVGRPRPLELDSLDPEERVAGDGQLEHLGTGRGRRGVSAGLERLRPRRHESQLVQAERFGRDSPDDQMAVMDGIEGAAEEAYRSHVQPRA